MSSSQSHGQLADGLFDLSGRVAVVTGASAWLGYDTADVLASAGCQVIVTSRVRAKAEEAAAKLRQAHAVETLGLALDQEDPASIAAFAGQAQAWQGRLDILVNNAGGGSGASEGNLFQRAPEDIVRMINVNLTGVILCCREIGRIMAEQHSGSIINIASIAGLVGRDRAHYRATGVKEQPVDYAAAKAGVIGFTRDLASFLAPHGVRANAISPGGFDKGLLPPAFVAQYAAKTPAGRMGTMHRDLKGAALFLASDASAYVNGHNLVVDGGFSISK